MESGSSTNNADLVLACEDFSDSDFDKFHTFKKNDLSIISQLMAHGPVLLKGGRGTGKSALLREANNRLNKGEGGTACGIYLSLRHLPLLRSKGEQYEKEFLKILVDRIDTYAKEVYEISFQSVLSVYEVQKALIEFSQQINKRVVLFFDDAAHIGREAGLEEFFDIFRTLSCSRISCKAAIYPGVTKFGTRFDVYNDARIIDISRRYGQDDFADFFLFVMRSRFSQAKDNDLFSKGLPVEKVAEFLGLTVLGNVRSFIQGCSILFENHDKITLKSLNDTLHTLASDFFWPMIEEVKTKVGVYEPLMENCFEMAEIIFKECGEKRSINCLVHRQWVGKFAKVFEILEYVGFISKREASRAMKSGGRGSRYAVIPCGILEKIVGARLTQELLDSWRSGNIDDVQLAANSTTLSSIVLGTPNEEGDIGILSLSIDKLLKSKAIPYGLTPDKINRLRNAGISTVGELAEKSESELQRIDWIGPQNARRIKNAVEQAIWM